ncbi:unnamed protein product [Phytomonas sp. Hart1]|nr:unnamed protein product [Phytomonas sp. Hart1]|eukprot:CCW66000.1 unnamed protein product [Phytomonas sp. isolate Hart1]
MPGSQTENQTNHPEEVNITSNVESSQKPESLKKDEEDADLLQRKLEAAEAMRKADNAYQPYSVTDNM